MGAAIAFQLRGYFSYGDRNGLQAAASFPVRPVALARDAGQFDVSNVSVGSVVSVLHANQHRSGGVAKSWTPMSKYLDTGKTLPERLSRALRRRIFPNTALQRKQVCAAIGCHRHTLDSLIVGATARPDAALIYQLMQFFEAPAFLGEVFPGVERLRQNKAERLRAELRD